MERKNLIGYPIVGIIVALITYYCTRESGPVTPPTPVAPKEIISLDDAKELYKSYTQNRSCVIEAFESKKDSALISLCPSNRKPDPDFVPSRSFYLSSEFLEQYMAYIKLVGKDQNVKITGYRIYLGNYPDKEKFDDGKPIKDPRRNTFFIAPTTIEGTKKLNKGFTFKDQDGDGKPEILFLEDQLDRYNDVGENNESSKVNTASFFSLSTTFDDELSTLGNEFGGHPPKN